MRSGTNHDTNDTNNQAQVHEKSLTQLKKAENDPSHTKPVTLKITFFTNKNTKGVAIP